MEEDSGKYDSARDVFWASGAAFGVRRDVFLQLGGFDEEFVAHQEEIDLCWRMQIAEWRVGIVPQSVVYHLGGGTLGADSPQKLMLNFRNNLAMLCKCTPKPSLWWILPTRLVLDWCASLAYLITGKWSYFKAVCKAHAELWQQRARLIKQHNEINPERGNRPKTIYKGSIIARYCMGRKNFGELM